MKGKLCKTDNVWYVMGVEEGDWNTYYPLHPEDVKICHTYGDYSLDWEDKEVEFEIKYYWDETMEQPIDVAKLIELGEEKKLNLQTLETKLDKSLSEETDWTLSRWLKSKREQKELIIDIMNKDEKDGLYENDVDKLGNEDVPKLGYDVEKLAETLNKTRGIDAPRTDTSYYQEFKIGVEMGYNKAKETLYTEEDIDKILSMYTDNAPASYIKRDYKKYLLKQIKNKK